MRLTTCQLLNNDLNIKCSVLLDNRIDLVLHALGLTLLQQCCKGRCSVDFSLPFPGAWLRTPAGWRRLELPLLSASPDNFIGKSLCGSVALESLCTYLTAVLKQNWVYCSFPSARWGKLAEWSGCRRAVATGRRCGVASALPRPGHGNPAHGEQDPWAGPGRARCRGRGGCRSAPEPPFCGVAAGESLRAAQVSFQVRQLEGARGRSWPP